jgi:hypothetical protein
MPQPLDYKTTPSPFDDMFQLNKQGEPTSAYGMLPTPTPKVGQPASVPSLFSSAVHPLITLFQSLFGQAQPGGQPAMATSKPLAATPTYGPRDVPTLQSLSSYTPQTGQVPTRPNMF